MPPALVTLITTTAFFPHNDNADAIAKSLRDLGGENPVVTSSKFVVFTEVGPITGPLFLVQKTGSGPKAPIWACVDNGNRHYEESDQPFIGKHWGPIAPVHKSAFQNFLESNKLPGGLLYCNVDGARPDQASTDIVSTETPRSHITTGDVLDAAALVGLFAAGGIGVVAAVGGSLALAGGAREIPLARWRWPCAPPRISPISPHMQASSAKPDLSKRFKTWLRRQMGRGCRERPLPRSHQGRI